MGTQETSSSGSTGSGIGWIWSRKEIYFLLYTLDSVSLVSLCICFFFQLKRKKTSLNSRQKSSVMEC